MADWPYSTANWQRLRKLKLATSPWCEGCRAMGKPYVLANTVDHIVPMPDGPAFPALDGLRAYCAPCHSAKTARGPEAGAVRSSKPRRGCDDAGNPLDAAHPWKSLKADLQGPPGDMNIELVSNATKRGLGNGR